MLSVDDLWAAAERKAKLREAFASPVNDSLVDEITAAIGEQFRTFGGGRGSNWNPIAEALKSAPPQFAAGVDVRQVVDFVLRLVNVAILTRRIRVDPVDTSIKPRRKAAKKKPAAKKRK